MQSTERCGASFTAGIPHFWRRGCLLAVLVFSWPGLQCAAEGPGIVKPSVSHRQRALERFEHTLAQVQPLLTRYGYGAMTLALLVEGTGIPAPGQTLLIASSLEATAGRMNIALVLVLATLATSVGNSIGYAIGRWGGLAVLRKFNVNPERQRRLESLFKRRGGIVVLLARFVDGLRQLNGIAAGILRMPWWTFTSYNVAGAILWTFAWGLGTYYLERDIHKIAGLFQRHQRVFYMLACAALVFLVVYLLRRGKSQKKAGENNA